LEELNRVLGGGFVPGEAVLLAGEPGMGKSTLLLQVASQAATRMDVLYVSGEESAAQVRLRAERLSALSPRLYLMSTSSVEDILGETEQLRPGLLIVDSIQTVELADLDQSAGSVSQVREAAAALVRLAKEGSTVLVLVGHVTKEGMLAGPKVLEHLVDAVLYLEGDRFHQFRILRAVKNRFGSTNEVGVFEMNENGMREVSDPSAMFLEDRNPEVPGTAVGVAMEGSRPLVFEVQALVSPTVYPMPKREANGFDFHRFQMLMAVLTRRLGLHLADQDVYINVVGGLTVSDPAADLAAAMAVVSAARDRPLDPAMVFIGEVGLTGELRRPVQMERRLQEAMKLGFANCVAPPFKAGLSEGNVKVLCAADIGTAVNFALSRRLR
jgi:DNA repair protein RadA/Sms